MASHDEAATEAKRARESHEAIRERYLNALVSAQGLDLSEAKERDQEQKMRDKAATLELERAEKRRTEARERQDALQDEHAALHLATGLEPGESCPVCAQTVPQDFKTPMYGPLDQELSEATEATKKAELAYQKASREFTEVRTALQMAQQRLAEERNKLLALGKCFARP